VNSICIGIYLHSEPQRLAATLSGLKNGTPQQCELILLPDGPDQQTRESLRNLPHLVQLGTDEPVGAAACFNRLASYSDADVVVFLESGTQVGPGWLERLLRALYEQPGVGLAGPSTNNSWNEQRVVTHAGERTREIAHIAAELAQRFGNEVRSLEPLHSLADFCYAVRHEVIEAVGAADENYSLGPCWEMDYNIRAARAGWRGVWACAAYVHRAPFTARRKVEESRRFEASKRLYQNKFCGARLRGEKTDYRSHCRGDACPNFAPANLIEIKRSFKERKEDFSRQGAKTQRQTAAPSEVSQLLVNELGEPLVTCIMPTYNRRGFVPQAIRCFLRQDYSRLELLVLDDGSDPVSDLVPNNDRIRYLRLNQKLTIGAKRNLACEQARGEFIVHWDDDDWYPRWRVRTQINALLERGYDLCGSSRIAYYDAVRELAWEYRYPTTKAPWVGGNTLAYRKSFWARNKFPDIQIGEDSRFVWSSPGKLIRDLADPTLCVASVHSDNTSRKDVKGCYWHEQARDYIASLLGDDIYFYGAAVSDKRASWPLVSCIMPTYERRRYVAQAVQSFLQQDYPNRELIAVDDGHDAIADLVQGQPNVRYLRVTRTSIGAKRNLACQHARGDIIAHWDDDDWYSPDRLRYQVAPILAGKADLTGLENAFVLELPGGEFWTTEPQLHQRLFVGNVHGGTIVYRKQLWTQGLRYPETNLGEDAWLLDRAMKQGKRLVRLANPGVFIYVRHGRNAWRQFAPGKFLDPTGWQRISAPLDFPLTALEFYKNAEKSR
jgi:glycosyltransferase involved in cell wall biosynthesis